MIEENYVSFECAKLLKEKGFNEYTGRCFVGEEWESPSPLTNNQLPDGRYSRPTLQMVLKWLREVHNILLVVDYEWECDTTPYYFKIYCLGENGKPERVPVKGVSYDKDDNPTEHIVGYRDWKRSYGDYSTYEEACEGAILYCVEKLI